MLKGVWLTRKILIEFPLEKMVLCLSTGTLFQLPLREVFGIAKEAGFEGIELLISPSCCKPYDLAEAFSLSERVLPVKVIHSPFFRFKHWWGKISSLRKAILWGRVLGASLVTFHPPSWFNLELIFWLWILLKKDFSKEKAPGLELAVEIMPVFDSRRRLSGYFWNNPRNLSHLAKKKGLGLTLDITHMGTRTADIIPFFSSLYDPDLVKEVHFSDWSPKGQHLFPGRGDLPIVRFLSLLKRLNFQGILTVELTPRELSSGDRRKLLEELKAIVDLIKEVGG